MVKIRPPSDKTGLPVPFEIVPSRPEPVGLEPREGMGHGRPVASGHDHIPVSVPGVDQFKRRFDKIFDFYPSAIF